MIKLEHIVLASPDQMEFIIEGMRNPMNSWEKSDSEDCCIYSCRDDMHTCPKGGFVIGPDDLVLMQRLSNAGTDHRKFMRMMPVYVRITAPLYWWKEFETYRVGVCPNPTDIEMNSCSTMHKIQEKEFTLEDFSCEHLIDEYDVCDICADAYDGSENPTDVLKFVIDMLNEARRLYLKTKDKKYWWQLIQLLPSSYNQTRNVMMNYEVLANMYKSRINHKLDEWREFCKWIETLSYSELITGGKE